MSKEHSVINKKWGWFQADNNSWIVIVEIKNHLHCETYRVRIEQMEQDGVVFCHYKYDRFIYSERKWTLDITKSELFLPALVTIREAYFQHISKYNPKNIVLTFKVNETKRFKICQHFFCKDLIKLGYSYHDCFQNTFSAIICYRDQKLVQMEKNNTLNDFLNRLTSINDHFFEQFT